MLNLFTNVPIDSAICCFETNLCQFHESDIKISELLYMTNLCVEHSAFMGKSTYSM